MHSNMKNIFITGANGFIGRHLCRRLREQGMNVRGLVRSEPLIVDPPWDEVYCCDLATLRLPEGLLHGIDTVFHLAGIAHAFRPLAEMEDVYWRVNLKATSLLLQEAARAGVKRFVYFSSVKAMADPGENCVDETFADLPGDTYGLSKRQAEEAVLQVGRVSSMHVCVLRPALVYGPGAKGNLLKMMRGVQKGWFPPLADTGNRRSMVHVMDLVDAAVPAADRQEANGRVYIVTDGVLYSTRQIYEAMCAALGRKVPGWTVPVGLLRFGAAVGDLCKKAGIPLPVNSETVDRLIGSACYRSDLLQRELGWQPRHTFFDTVDEMADLETVNSEQ